MIPIISVLLTLNTIYHIVISATIISPVEEYSIFYAIAINIGESQTETCLRNNGLPLSKTFTYPTIWNITAFNFVVASLNRTVSTVSVNGIKGCCSQGVWCDNTGCFTQSSGGSFVNYGWLNNDTNSFPVYSCHSTMSTVQIPQLVISSLSYDKGMLQLIGTNFNTDEDMITATIGGDICTDVEICNSSQCKSCATSQCPNDSECIVGDGRESCYMYCAGEGDKSCPCGSFCDSVTGKYNFLLKLNFIFVSIFTNYYFY